MIRGGNPEDANRESNRSYLSAAASTVADENSGLDMGKHGNDNGPHPGGAIAVPRLSRVPSNVLTFFQ
jgi:hypothetical protein